jgi:aminoglycoside phosphotransferase (APT) family kinase protein
VTEDNVLARRLPRPVEALEWAARAIGKSATVGRVRRLRGGTSTTMHAVDVIDRRGSVHRLVLRRYVNERWVAEEPDLAEREARVLDLLAGSNVAAPRPVAVDPDGRSSGVPAVLMTRLPGRVILDPPDLEGWLRGMAEELPLIHDVRVGRVAVQPFAPYYDLRKIELPRWTKQPRLWERALEIAQKAPPKRKRRFIHRDYHPANVLWSRGKATGVIDWPNASIGPREVDVAHCRGNLAILHGVDVADAFLDAYRSVTGLRDYDPHWDLARVFDGNFHSQPRVWEGWTELGIRGLSSRVVATRLEEFVKQAVERE